MGQELTKLQTSQDETFAKMNLVKLYKEFVANLIKPVKDLPSCEEFFEVVDSHMEKWKSRCLKKDFSALSDEAEKGKKEKVKEIIKANNIKDYQDTNRSQPTYLKGIFTKALKELAQEQEQLKNAKIAKEKKAQEKKMQKALEDVIKDETKWGDLSFFLRRSGQQPIGLVDCGP